MGTLLLQGYAMLEETCPDCNVPIMRSRSKEELCVVCGQAYKNRNMLGVNTTSSTAITEDRPQIEESESMQKIDSCF